MVQEIEDELVRLRRINPVPVPVIFAKSQRRHAHFSSNEMFQLNVLLFE